MIRISRAMGHCATCAGPVSTYWAPPVAPAPTLILRIVVGGRTGVGGTIDLDEHHARQLVHSPSYDDGRCASCGNTGAVQVVGAVTVGTRTRPAFAVCRRQCAAHLVDQIGVALTLRDGEATEWDEMELPSWAVANRDAANGRRR